MAADATTALRRAALTLLKATSAVTARVPAARIYPPTRPAAPTWPFVAYDTIRQGAFRASCMDGAVIRFQVAAYAKDTKNPASDGEEAAAAIGGAVMAALDGAVLTLGDGSKAHVTWLESNLLRDGAEGSSWQHVSRFEAAVTREA